MAQSQSIDENLTEMSKGVDLQSSYACPGLRAATGNILA